MQLWQLNWRTIATYPHYVAIETIPSGSTVHVIAFCIVAKWCKKMERNELLYAEYKDFAEDFHSKYIHWVTALASFILLLTTAVCNSVTIFTNYLSNCACMHIIIIFYLH